MAIVSISDYYDLVNEDLSDLPADYVNSVIEAVERAIVDHYGQPLVQTSFEEEVEGRLTNYGPETVFQFTVNYLPVQSVASVTVWYSSEASSSLDVSSVIVNSGAGIVRVPFGYFGTWQAHFRIGTVYRADVTYTAGEEVTPPPSVKRAIALLVQEQLSLDAESTREDANDVVSYSIGDYSETRRRVEDSIEWGGLGMGNRNSRQAVKTLNAYLRGAGAVFV